MKILITGAQGYLGALLFAELRNEYDIVGTARSRFLSKDVIPLDIRDIDLMYKCFASVMPDVVIHTAAISNVASCEENPAEAFRTNAGGTLNIAQAANEIGAKVILISSLAAQNPLTVYGNSKQAAENHIRMVKAGYEILQLSMTFGLSPNTTNNRPFNKILRSMKSGLPQLYDNKWKFQPTHTEHFLSVISCILQRPFGGNNLTITIEESSTMHQIASDVLNPDLVIGAPLYQRRAEQLVDTSHLSRLGFPTTTYCTMIKRLREQLKIANTNFVSFSNEI
ncbi:MAG: sugar nucleotide-binding protein [Gallionella sp.]|nr:sugar nucleotide-binding protein [Gallionella sp.]MDD4958680.1 sugar nucleotide-binding protein [Gallionella sp.]